jgi:hypothetical protein
METQVGGLAVGQRRHCDDPLGCLPVHGADQFSLGCAWSGRSAPSSGGALAIREKARRREHSDTERRA